MAEYSIIITTEDIANATSYVPVSEKKMVSQGIAFFCCEAAAPEAPDSMKNLPPIPFMVQEDRKLRQQFQMGILADYLGREYPAEAVIIPGPDGTEIEHPLTHCMAEDEYDKWAGSHVLNQLERLKKSKESGICDKVFDILFDYKNFENMISAAIRDRMVIHNDGLNRALEFVSRFASEEAAQAVMQAIMQSKSELTEALNDVDAYKKQKQGESDE